MMFTGEDRQALQTLIDNNMITPEDQLTPSHALKAIQTTIKEEEHYWYYRHEMMSNIRQQPNEQINTLNTRITMLVNNCRISGPPNNRKNQNNASTTHHKIPQSQRLNKTSRPSNTYIPTTPQQLQTTATVMQTISETQQKGRADLTSIVATSSTYSSIHQDAITTHPNQTICYKCGCSHQRNSCPATGQQCHKYNGTGHF